MFSITMFDSSTRVYLDPPLKHVSEIQLLDCNIKTKRLITLLKQEKITDVNDNTLVTIKPGTYSLNDLKLILALSEKGQNITIYISDNISFIINNKSFNIKLSAGLQNTLCLPEVLIKSQIYKMTMNITGPLKLFCSLIDNRMSYMNKNENGHLTKIQPSQLLANIPSQDYPTIPIEKYDNLINHFDLTILNSDLELFDLKGSPITFSLRFK